MMEGDSEVRKPRKGKDAAQVKPKPKGGASKKAKALAKSTAAIENVPRRIQDEFAESISGQDPAPSVEELGSIDDDAEGAEALREVEDEVDSQDDFPAQCDRHVETIRILKGEGEQVKLALGSAQKEMIRVKKVNAEMTKALSEKEHRVIQLSFITDHALDPLRSAIESNEKMTATLQDENAVLKARAEKAEREQRLLEEAHPPLGLALSPRPLSMKLTTLAPPCCAGFAAQSKGVGRH